MRASWLALLLLLVAAASAQAAVAAAAAAESAEVHLRNGFFDPLLVGIYAGDTITFTDQDDRPHTVTSAWDDGKAFHVVLIPGQSVPIRFQQAGTYPIRCLPHSTMDASGMHGMVTSVKVASAGAPTVAGRALPVRDLLVAGASVAMIVSVLVVSKGLPRRKARS